MIQFALSRALARDLPGNGHIGARVAPHCMIDDTTLDHLGRLARLAIDPAARPRLAADLDRILGLFERLRTLPLDGVAPLAHPHDQSVGLRADQVSEEDQADRLLALAAESQGGYYLVPKVIE